MVGHTWEGTPVTYYHPVVQSAFMFLGEFMCLLPYAWSVWRSRRASKRLAATSADGRLLEEPLLLAGASEGAAAGAPALPGGANASVTKVFAFALPTLCDALTTTLMNVGLYYTSASVFQMLRGTVVFFAGAPRIQRT